MSTTGSIISSQTEQPSRRKSDTTWTLGSSSATIGAGVLFFPIRAGSGELILILIMLVLAYPIAFYCHRALARLCPSSSNPSGNITETVEEHFGKTGGVVVTFLYFFTIRPLLWIYGVTIISTFTTFWGNRLQMSALDRGFVAFFLLLLMAFATWFDKDLVVRVMSYLVWPFIASLALISLSLIPYRNFAVIDQVDLSNIVLTGHDGILVTVWLGISIVVFFFNLSPIVSSFVVPKYEKHEEDFGREFTEQKCFKIISRASVLMITVVMFFAFSCLFTLSPVNMADTRTQNIPVLSYLIDYFVSPSGTKSIFATALGYGASTIALVAIFRSFFDYYLGALEGPNGLVSRLGYKDDKAKVSTGKLNIINMIFIIGSTWVMVYANPNTLDLTEVTDAPIIVPLLCLLLMYATHKAPSLAKYRGRPDSVFVTAIGLLTILNIVYKLF